MSSFGSLNFLFRHTARHFSRLASVTVTVSAKMASTEPAAAPWYAAYPAPRNTQPGTVTREEVLAMAKLQEESTAGGDFIFIDLRRTDHEVMSIRPARRNHTARFHSDIAKGGTIQGSINLPAQSLHPTIPALYALFKAAGLRKVIWYCCR
jgi:arsenical-resistance protein 2